MTMESEKLPSPRRGGAPWLMFSDGKDQTFYSISDPDEYCVRRQLGAFQSVNSIGQSAYGWLLLRREAKGVTTSFSLWNPNTLETIKLPVFNDGTFFRAILTSPPDHPNSMVIAFDRLRPRVAHCRLNNSSTRSWTVQDLSHELPEWDDWCCGCWDQVVCRGTLYAITPEGDGSRLFEIKCLEEEDGCRLAVRLLVDGGAKVRLDFPVRLRRLVDLDGDLLQIVRCSVRSDPDRFMFLAVYKLDTSSMVWVQVRTLEGRSIFISGYHTFSCSDVGGGIKPNHVYHFRADLQPFSFDVETGQSSCYMLPSPPVKFNIQQRPPPIRACFLNNNYYYQQTTCQFGEDDEYSCAVATKPEETYEEEDAEGKALILKLPSDIHFNIARRHLVSVSDYRNFHASCKRFRLAAPIVSPPSSNPLQSPSYPWFFSFEHCHSIDLKLHDLRCRNTFIKHLPSSLSDSFLLLSKERWLVMLKSNHIGNFGFHLYNPFTKAVRTIPDMVSPIGRVCFGISTAPTSPYCSIIGLAHSMPVEGRFIKFMESCEDPEWHTFRYEKQFQVCLDSPPAFLANKFYFFDKSNQLGVFSYGRNAGGQLEQKWDVYAWKHLDNHSGSVSFEDYRWNYLVECGGKILAVIMDDSLGKSVGVYMFDQEGEGWLEVNNLGAHMLFLSHTSCFSTVAKYAGMGNKIYFPRVSPVKGSMVFYSLDTHKYHTFDQEDMDDMRPTSKVQLSGWLEPPAL